MKKSFLIVLFVMLAASMFAADLSVTLDAGLIFDKENGLRYRTPQTESESEYTAALSVAYDGESFGGHFEMRNEAEDSPYAYGAIKDPTYKKSHPNSLNNYFFTRNYGVYVKPCQEVKIAIDAGSVELLAENISWEPLFAASLFETQASPSLIVTWDVDAHLQLITGVNTLVEDHKKPWTGLGMLASYEVFGVGKFIAKYESLVDEWDCWDAGLAFQLLALDTQDVYAGYNVIMPETSFKPIQHRVELFYGISIDALSLSCFNSLELKTLDKFGIGDRFAFNATYYWNNIIPSLSVNYYYNFNGGSHLWGAPDTATSKCNKLDIDPRVSFTFGQGTLSTGARLSFNFRSKKERFTWYIPLGITVGL